MDRGAAERNHRIYVTELPTVRQAAVPGVTVLPLLVGLLGFGLIKGRSDISQLAQPWAAIVGLLLLAALVVGVGAADSLLQAAHGRPRHFKRGKLGSPLAFQHAEALRATSLLNNGIRLSLASAALLVVAVAITWYGPDKQQPELRVMTADKQLCGSVVHIHAGVLTLKTSNGQVDVKLDTVIGISAVVTCGQS